MVFLDGPPPSGGVDYVWHFYNRDGSRGEMCGNAARCTARLAHALGLAPAVHTFATLARARSGRRCWKTRDQVIR